VSIVAGADAVSDELSNTRRRRGTSPTLADVGALAGVSAATASRVLNGTGRHVAETLRRRVLAAAEQLDYVPNAHAQALMRPDARAVGVIAFDVNNPYFTEIIGGILDVAAETDRLVTIGNVFRDPRTELRYLSLLRSQRVGSLVLTGSGWTDPDHVRRLQARLDGFRAAGGRVVLIGRHNLTGDVLLPDNVGGGGAAARALLGLGHTRIGVISGRDDMTVTADRLRGFLEPCEKAGHPVAPERIVPGNFTTEGGASAMIALLERAPDITAVFCLSDAMAVGALRVLSHRGIDVPREISVMGFDDIALAGNLTPALSTVRVPLVQLGETAMQLLLEPEPGESRTRHFPTELRLRGTTGRAPR
jgi:LacI family transcriptional regulator